MLPQRRKGEKEASFLPGGNGTSRNPFSAAAYGAGRQVGRVIRPAFGTGQTVQNLPLWTIFADCVVNIDMNLLAALPRSPRKGSRRPPKAERFGNLIQH
jgi:hypothetical protein